LGLSVGAASLTGRTNDCTVCDNQPDGVDSESTQQGVGGVETEPSTAERYRLEAARLRREATIVRSEDVRRQILNTAQIYEDLAAIVETLPPRPGPLQSN
jgi:hypothetical protein